MEWLLFFEFLKIGLFALGGGMVTVPFLFNLSEKYAWFSTQELVDMIAISESSPGPIGINMATYAGLKTSGFFGGIIATTGLVLPSLIIIIFIAKLLEKYRNSKIFNQLMYTIHPAVIALILCAAAEIGKLIFADKILILICLMFWGAIRLIKLHPIAYIIMGGIIGICLKL